MNWVWIGANLPLIAGYVAQHIALSILPIVLGFLLSIPLGYWASRSPVARAVLLTLGNILYTIPSLALVVLVPVLLGLAILDSKNVIVALLIYALAIMVRSAADAFAAVPENVRQSAVALGYSPAQRFFRVELPLAGPVLLAGIRVVSVSTLSLVTVGALIGVPSLGNLFTDGFQRSFPTEILVGIVLVLVLAAVFDLILSTIGRLLMPWSRRRTRAIARGSELSKTLQTPVSLP